MAVRSVDVDELLRGLYRYEAGGLLAIWFVLLKSLLANLAELAGSV